MIFTLQTSEIKNTFALLIKIVEEKSTMPILASVLIEIKNNQIKFTGTNLETTIFINTPCEIGFSTHFIVPAKNLAQFISLIRDNTVNFEIKEKELEIKTKTSKINIPLGEPNDFPVIKPIENIHTTINLPTTDFRQAIESTSFAMATDALRPALHALFFTTEHGHATYVGTDGFKMTEFCGNQILESTKFLIPARVALLLPSLLGENTETKLQISDKNIFIENGDIQIQFSLVDATFPDYRAIMKIEPKTTLKIKSSDFQHAFKMARIYSDKGIIKLEIKNGKCELLCKSAHGSEKVEFPAQVTGEDNYIFLRDTNILDFLARAASTDDVDVTIESAARPLMMKIGQNYTCVVMHVKENTVNF